MYWMTQARVRVRSARPIDRKGQGHRHCFAAGDGAMQNNPNPRTPAMRHTTKVVLGGCDRASIALPQLPYPIDGLIMLSTPGNRTIAHHPMLSIGTFVKAKPAKLSVGIPAQRGTGGPLQEHLSLCGQCVDFFCNRSGIPAFIELPKPKLAVPKRN